MESIGVFWILSECFGIFQNLLESFKIFEKILKFSGIFQNPDAFGMKSYFSLVSSLFDLFVAAENGLQEQINVLQLSMESKISKLEVKFTGNWQELKL